MTVLHDTGYALRTLTKQPGFALVALLTLCTGHRRQHGDLRHRERRAAASAAVRPARSCGSAVESLDQLDEDVGVAARARRLPAVAIARARRFFNTSFNLTGAGEPLRVLAATVQPEIFAALGARPLVGRGFTPEEDEPGREHVVMLTEGLWRSQFGSDPVRTRSAGASRWAATIAGSPSLASSRTSIILASTRRRGLRCTVRTHSSDTAAATRPR